MMENDRDIQRIDRVLAAYGADIARWPAKERSWFVHLDSPLRQTLAQRMAASKAARLDKLLENVTVEPATASLAAQILAQSGHIGAIRAPDETHPPSPRVASGVPVFGWPRAGMLAAAALLGFVLGWFEPTSVNGGSGETFVAQVLFGSGDLEIES
jgi:hypothetical protein